jgi:hypothetical protein
MGSPVRRYVVSLAALSMIFVGVLVSGATAASPTKPYSADITPACVPLSTPTPGIQFTVTLRNTTKTQMLGSANVTAPAGFVITSATPDGATVELRNLNIAPGGTASRVFTATTSGTAGPADWSIIAKQSNDYNGSPGNNLTLDTANSHLRSYVDTCVLVFGSGPASATTDLKVTSEPFNPTGAPVTVQVRNAPGGQVVITSTDEISLALSASGAAGALTPSTPTATAVQGVAVFDASTATNFFSVSPPHFGYQLVASSSNTGIDATTPATFDVWGVGTKCTGKGCEATLTQDGVTADVLTPDSAFGNLLAISFGVEPTLVCAPYVPLLPDNFVVSFMFDGAGNRQVTITVPGPAPRPVSQDRVCYDPSGPQTFVDRSGNTVEIGLLPDCKNNSPKPPCQLPPKTDKLGNQIISFLAPPGSTRGRT